MSALLHALPQIRAGLLTASVLMLVAAAACLAVAATRTRRHHRQPEPEPGQHAAVRRTRGRRATTAVLLSAIVGACLTPAMASAACILTSTGICVQTPTTGGIQINKSSKSNTYTGLAGIGITATAPATKASTAARTPIITLPKPGQTTKATKSNSYTGISGIRITVTAPATKSSTVARTPITALAKPIQTAKATATKTAKATNSNSYTRPSSIKITATAPATKRTTGVGTATTATARPTQTAKATQAAKATKPSSYIRPSGIKITATASATKRGTGIGTVTTTTARPSRTATPTTTKKLTKGNTGVWTPITATARPSQTAISTTTTTKRPTKGNTGAGTQGTVTPVTRLDQTTTPTEQNCQLTEEQQQQLLNDAMAQHAANEQLYQQYLLKALLQQAVLKADNALISQQLSGHKGLTPEDVANLIKNGTVSPSDLAMAALQAAQELDGHTGGRSGQSTDTNCAQDQGTTPGAAAPVQNNADPNSGDNSSTQSNQDASQNSRPNADDTSQDPLPVDAPLVKPGDPHAGQAGASSSKANAGDGTTAVNNPVSGEQGIGASEPAGGSGPGGDEPILWGQSRISPDYSSSNPHVPDYLRGRSIDDVVGDLTADPPRLSPDQFRIIAIRYGGKLITNNNRSLAVLTMAGLRPTNVIVLETQAEIDAAIASGDVDNDIIVRLNEPTPLGDTLPANRIAITPSQSDWTVLKIVYGR